MTGYRYVVGLVGGTLLSAIPAWTVAQVIPDGTTPTPNPGSCAVLCIINGGTTDVTGRNLFHSFEQFDVPTNGGVLFNNVPSIQNILTRITGDTPSEIDGVIQANSTANVFLLNPNGILFRDNARLDIGGSFVATTADAIAFQNQGRFSAHSTTNDLSLLTVNPSAFLFNRLVRGDIQSSSIAPAGTDASGLVPLSGLRVPDGKNLLLIGGNVTLNQGGLTTLGGNVVLGGLDGTGRMSLGETFNIRVPVGTPQADVSLRNGEVSVSAGGGGSIAIAAQDIVLSNSFLGAGLGFAQGTNDAVAGDILLNAAGTVRIANGSLVGNIGLPFSQGDNGNIRILGRDIVLANSGNILTANLGSGDSGNLFLRAEEGITLSGRGANGDSSVIFTGALTPNPASTRGRGGDIRIVARSVLLTDGAVISSTTANAGRGGNIQLVVSDRVSLTVDSVISTDTVGQEPAGSIRIATDRLTLQNRSSLTASTYDSGAAGNIRVSVRNLTVRDSYVSSSTFGPGDAGNLVVSALDAIELSGEVPSFSPGGLLAQVDLSGTGQGGNLFVDTNRLRVSDGSKIQVATFGQGDAGRLRIRSSQIDVFETPRPNFFTTSIFAGVGFDPRSTVLAEGDGGNLSIESNHLRIRGGEVSVNTAGAGNAGRLFIHARDHVEVIDTSAETGYRSFLTANVEEGARGNGGDLVIETHRLMVRGAQVSASTFGEGSAGNLRIEATDSIELSGESLPLSNEPRTLPGGLFAQVDLLGTGRGGNLLIDTGHLSIRDGSVIQVAALGEGNAGRLQIRASQIDVFETPQFNTIITGIFAGSRTVSGNPPPRGNGGNLSIESDRLSIRGGQVSVSTAGEGDAGSLFVRTRDRLEVMNVNVQNDWGSALTANVDPGATGEGGNLTIETRQLNVANGGQIGASTFGRGDAGNVRIRATESIDIGRESLTYGPSQVSALVGEAARGNGGDLAIATERLTVRDGAQVSVSSQGIGLAGNLAIATDRLLLSDRGQLVAETPSGENANIQIQANDYLVMRRQSLISARAFNDGNGGNVDIDSGFVIAAPLENSDIIANADEGNGGNIDITAQGIYGLEPRDPLTEFSDINASSRFGTDGVIATNTPDVDPSRGLAELPTTVVDASNLIAQGCSAGGGSSGNLGEFVVTGRGGLPTQPNEILNSDTILSPWVDSNGPESNARGPVQLPSSSHLVEAQTWARDEYGRIVLTTPGTSGSVHVAHGSCTGS